MRIFAANYQTYQAPSAWFSVVQIFARAGITEFNLDDTHSHEFSCGSLASGNDVKEMWNFITFSLTCIVQRNSWKGFRIIIVNMHVRRTRQCDHSFRKQIETHVFKSCFFFKYIYMYMYIFFLINTLHKCFNRTLLQCFHIFETSFPYKYEIFCVHTHIYICIYIDILMLAHMSALFNEKLLYF